MALCVRVKFSATQDYELLVSDADIGTGNSQSARAWLDEQFVEQECDPPNPTGKTLIMDKIIAVAGAMGPKPFAERSQWACEFACNTALALSAQSNITIDLAERTVRR